MDQLKGILGQLSYLNLDRQITNVSEDNETLKGFSLRCRAWSNKHGRQVTVKRIRLHLQNDEELTKRLAREIEACACIPLGHPNVLPFLGYFFEGTALPSLVFEWMEKGSLDKHMKTFPRASKQTCTMLSDIASGLAHLHAHGVIHGCIRSVCDLKTGMFLGILTSSRNIVTNRPI